MLDMRLFRENPEIIKEALRKRDSDIDIEPIIKLDARRREIIVVSEGLRKERNEASKAVAVAKAKGEDATDSFEKLRGIGDRIKELEAELEEVERGLAEKTAEIPNIPHGSVPVGPDDCFNIEVRKWGAPRSFHFEPKGHLEVGDNLDIVDLSRGAKIAGSRFALMKGLGARLERALINFMLDLHIKEHGYSEVFPPILVSERSMFNTGQLPKLRDEMYSCTDDFFLIPTAEVPVTNIYSDEIITDEKFPVKFVAFTPCFRREAGAAGKETRGLIRLHQFNKVEMVRIVKPDNSFEELESLTNDAEDVLKRLNLPYRVVVLSTGDLSFAAAKCYDLEVWLPSYNDYKEISSCSNFTDFQARRANIKYRDDTGKPRLVHTLNGSGVAIGRTVAAILENYQNEDGSVSVPPALIDYMDGLTRITAEKH